ncbi:hypothetical protein B0T10DRAFT_490645 [Thelonectria olida]|uniref:Uncharacterized protein n=1 Tax=Thelonectria olida TaxID=1576542 RepID=A0A9P9AKD7_9HYPO|nr:hypothetical protein B0T10DRAFT_490645 [Thelonectria olida]
MTLPLILSFSQRSPSTWDIILQFLDVEAIKNLRLTNRHLGGEALNPRLKHFLETKTTDLTDESLGSLAALAAHPFGVSVKCLTIVASLYDTSKTEEILKSGERCEIEFSGVFTSKTWHECAEEELASTRSDLAWLRKKKNEQQEASDETVTTSLTKALRAFRRLDALELDAVVYESPELKVSTLESDWPSIWQRASQVYRVAMTAVARSGVEVGALQVYSNTPRCSVSIHELAEHMQSLRADKFGRAGASITSFSLSICRETTRHDETEQARLGPDEPSLAGVAHLLEEMPNLATLDLHVYRTLGDVAAVFDPIASRIHLTSLQQCALRGISTDKKSLLQFLTNHATMKSLELSHMHIDAEWGPLIAQVVTVLPDLQRLHLSNLWANKVLTNLQPAWESAALKAHEREWGYPCAGKKQLVHTLVLDEGDLKREMEFQPTPRGRSLGSPSLRRWMLANRRDFGPP